MRGDPVDFSDYAQRGETRGQHLSDVIVTPMGEYLRERRILLPAAVTLEKIDLAARACS